MNEVRPIFLAGDDYGDPHLVGPWPTLTELVTGHLPATREEAQSPFRAWKRGDLVFIEVGRDEAVYRHVGGMLHRLERLEI